MNKHRLITPTLTCLIILCILTLTGCGGGGSIYPTLFNIDSVNVRDTYQIQIALPSDYALDDTTRYDTIYLLDGNWHFTTVSNIISELVHQGKMERVILVAIAPIEATQTSYGYGSPYRERDFGPGTDHTTEGGVGHADHFAAFIRDELIPYIDAHYRTNPVREGRGIMGHSLSGLFTWYAIFTMNDTFSRFVPASASVWWDNRVCNTYEADYAATHTDLPVAIYSTVGSVEDKEWMIDSREDLVTRLNARGYPSLSMQIITYDGLDHVQTIYPSFQDGLAALY